MLFITDKFALIFIYSIVLLPNLEIFNISISKIIFLFLLSSYFFYFSGNRLFNFSRDELFYISLSFAFVLFLVSVSLLKGNSLTGIAQLVSSFLILLTIPLFTSLMNNYGESRYIINFTLAIFFLGILMIISYLSNILQIDVTQYVSMFNTVQITFPDYGTRVLAQTGIFFCCGLLFACDLIKRGAENI